MALSGSFSKTVATYYKLSGEWTAKQDNSARTSTITLKTYWQSTSSYGSISSSVSKDTYSKINGTKKSSTFTAGLSGAQKKLINTQTVTVTHNADGTSGSIPLETYAELGLTLSGTKYSSVTATTTVTLDDLPSISELKLDEGWRLTFDNSFPISWTRYSSSFTHNLNFYVQNRAKSGYVRIARRTDLTTSTTLELTQAEKSALIAERSSGNGQALVILETINGSKMLGESQVQGVIELPERVTINAGSSSAGSYSVDKTYTIEQEGTVGLWDSYIDVKVGSTVIDTIPTFKNTTQFYFDPAKYLSYLGSKDSLAVTFDIYSLYDGLVIRDEAFSKPATIAKPSDPPKWSTTSKPSVIDVSTVGVGITGNNTMLIQNISKLRLKIPQDAVTTLNGTTLTKYRVYIGSTYVKEAVPQAGAPTEVDIGAWNLSGNQTIKIHAVDSYGNSSIYDLVVNLIPYQVPKVTSNNLAREGGYLGIINGAVSGSYSPILVSGVPKNSIASAKLEYRVKGSSTWLLGKDYIVSNKPTDGTFKTDSAHIIDLTETDTYETRTTVTDRLGNTTVLSKEIAQGTPLFFLDNDKKSVGFGKFPESVNTIETPYAIQSTSLVQGTVLRATTSEVQFNASGSQKIKYNGVKGKFELTTSDLTNVEGKDFYHKGNLEIQEGTAYTLNEAGVTVSINITFPKAFKNVPFVNLNVNTSAVKNIQYASATDITTTGFTLNFNRLTVVTSGSGTRLDWQAIAHS